MTERFGKGSAFVYVALVPISWSPFPANIQWSELAFVGFSIWFFARGRLAIRSPHPLDVLVMGYLLGGLMSVFGTTDFTRSLSQYAKHLYLGLVYYVFSTLARDPQWRRRLVSWFGAVAGVLAGSAVAAVSIHALLGLRTPGLGTPEGIPYLGKVSRAYGPFSSAAYFANYLTFVFPLVLAALAMARSKRKRQAWILTGAMVVVADVLTLTYSLVGLLPAGLYYVWTSLNVGGGKVLRAGLLVTTIIALIALNTMLIVAVREARVETEENPAVAGPPFAHGLAGRDGTPTLHVAISYNLMSYYLLKKVAWEAFWDRPWTGLGLGQFHKATERAYVAGRIHARYRIADPHSTLLGRLAETGIVGGILLLTLWGGAWYWALRARVCSTDDAWLTRALLAAILGLLVNSLNVDIMNFRFLWLGLALLLGSLVGSRGDLALREADDRRAPRAARS